MTAEIRKTKVVFVGPLPPPVTGMTVMSDVIVRALQRRGPVHCFSWSRPHETRGLAWRLARARGYVVAMVKLAFRCRSGSESVYTPANSGWGLFYDLLVVLICRARGYRVVLHHHVYAYIDCYDWRMAAVIKVIGDRGAHVVHCEKMRDDFLATYDSKAEFLFVPPTIVSVESADRANDDVGVSVLETTDRRRFCLGFLSNLTIEKGLETAVHTFEALVESGHDVQLLLAGPCMGLPERRVIQRATARWPDRIRYLGAVYGANKARFFSDINVFLFPTRYKNESWGIVLTEALTASRPVIAIGLGCIPWVVQGGCGVVVRRDEDFVEQATGVLRSWIEDRSLYRDVCARAADRAKELNREATDRLSRFVTRLQDDDITRVATHDHVVE